MTTPNSWYSLLSCDLAKQARTRMSQNTDLLYHNWNHIERCVWHAYHTFGFDFDLYLGKSVLTHDVIYDGLQNAEWRSAQWLLDTDGRTAENIVAVEHIMRTAGHALSEDNRMVMLDLGDFLYPTRIYQNFHAVVNESLRLYDASYQEVLDAGQDYMTKMQQKYGDNALADLPLLDRFVFLQIRQGIESVLGLYEKARKGNVTND